MLRGTRRRGLLVIVVAALAVAGCASVRQQLGTVLMPVETEVRLGTELAAQIEGQEKMLPDAHVQAYVDGVFKGLVAYSSQHRPEIGYRVRVLDDAKQVNAFALPGGYVYVYTGLMLLAENEAELAGVLAHELGHVVGRHSANRLGTQMGVALLTGLALGEQPAEVAQLAADLLGASTMAAFSREDEREADEYGLRYAVAAGYDPQGLATLFEKLMRLEGSGQHSVFEGLLASHPDTRERIALLQRRIAKTGATGGRLDQQEYAQIRNRLRSRYQLSN